MHPLAGFAQFAFQRQRHPVGTQRCTDIAEDDQEQRFDIVVRQRFDDHVDDLGAVIELDVDAGAADHSPGFDRLGQGEAQIEPQPAPGHRHDIPGRGAGRAFQIFAGARREVNDVPVARHDDMSGGELLDNSAFDDMPQRQRIMVADRRLQFEQALPPRGYSHRYSRMNSEKVAPPKNTVLLVNRSEQLAMLGQGLGCTEKQVAAGPQRIMKYRHQLLLQLFRKINQKVAARYQVDAREWRIADHAVRGEDAAIAHLLAKGVADAIAGEKTVDPLRADILQHRRRIARRAGDRDRRIIDIGGEDGKFRPRFQRRHVLEQQDGDRIGLLAGGAAGHPNADLVGRRLAFEQGRNDLLRQCLERVLVAEKRGDADQQILEEPGHLLMIAAQALDVIVDIAQFEHLHAAFDPTQEGAFLVPREIVPELVAQDVADRLARPGDALALGAIVAPGADV